MGTTAAPTTAAPTTTAAPAYQVGVTATIPEEKLNNQQVDAMKNNILQKMGLTQGDASVTAEFKTKIEYEISGKISETEESQMKQDLEKQFGSGKVQLEITETARRLQENGEGQLRKLTAKSIVDVTVSSDSADKAKQRAGVLKTAPPGQLASATVTKNPETSVEMVIRISQEKIGNLDMTNVTPAALKAAANDAGLTGVQTSSATTFSTSSSSSSSSSPQGGIGFAVAVIACIAAVATVGF